jgi:uncharacterized membrane protein
MSWLVRIRLRNYFQNALWPFPVAAIPVAMAALVLSRSSRWSQWAGLGFTADGARALVTGLVPATLTFIVLILSTLLLSIQLASSQFSPRLIAGLLTHRPIKVCLGIFVFSFVYSAGVTGRIEGQVPQLPVFVAIISTVTTVCLGLYLIDYMAKELRPVRMMARTARMGRAAVEHAYPRLAPEGTPEPAAAARNPLPEPWELITYAGRPGVLLEMDVAGLCALAESTGGRIEVIPQVGDFVAEGDALFRVHPKPDALQVGRLINSMAFGDERTPEQDPEFAFRILVDVAAKALSPAINDPTTAVIAIDQIHNLLRLVGLRHLDVGERRDGQGAVRLTYPTPSWVDFVLLAVIEVRHYGRDSIKVVRRLRAMLIDLASVVPPDRAVALDEQLTLLQRGIERSFPDPEDRVCAAISDNQGIGGSRLKGPRGSELNGGSAQIVGGETPGELGSRRASLHAGDVLPRPLNTAQSI